MTSAAHRRLSVGVISLVLALLAGLFAATPASSGEKGTQWLTQGSDPVGLQQAIASNGGKLPTEFTSRLRYVDNGLLRVIVATSERTPGLESFVADHTSWVRWYFDNPRFYAAVTPDGLKALLNSSAVTFVDPDVPLTYFMSSSTVDVHARSLNNDGTGVWSYDAATESLRSDIGALTVDQATGKGVTVAITDSGIDRTFKDFSGWDCVPGPLQPCNSRILRAVTTEHLFGGPDIGDSLPTTEAFSGHGSHVAGTIGGNAFYARDGGDDGATYGADGLPFGIAPQADLVMTKNGDAIWAGLSQLGLEWQLENAEEYNIRVSSNSWGCLGGCSFNGASAIGQLFKDMYDAGIVVTFAAGNDAGTDSGSEFSGNAQSPYVLGVAAYNDADHRLADFSSRGSDKTLPDPTTWTPASEPVNGERRPDVAAPGVDIWSARTLTGGAASLVPRANTSDVTGGGGCCIREYAAMSGTSMATPHVAGAAALAFSACPTSTSLDVMRAIMATAETDILKTTGSATAEAWEVGYGGLEVRRAVDWLLARNCNSSNSGGGEPTPDPTPSETTTPEPTPTETGAAPTGKTYYFHSASGIGNIDALEGTSSFDAAAPTRTGASTFYDLPGFQSTAAEQIYDPFWSGTIAEGSLNRLDVRFWQRAPLGDLLAEVHYDVSVFSGGTQYRLPTLNKAVPPTIGNSTGLIEGSFTTMLDGDGNEVPLSIPGGDVAVVIAGHFGDMEAGAYLQYDSITKPAGFTVYSAAPDPDTTPTETPTEVQSSDTEVAFTENTSGAAQYTDSATVEAQLTDAATGLPIEGADLVFELVGADGTREFRATTDATGTASETYTVVEKPGAFTYNVRYAGEEDRYNASSNTQPFVVEKEDSATALRVGGKPSNKTLTATLSESDSGTPLDGEVIEFFLEGTSLGRATTGANGTASLAVPKKDGARQRDYVAVFSDDDFYSRSSGSARG